MPNWKARMPNWKARRSEDGLESGRDRHLNRKTEGHLAQNQNWYFVKWKYQSQARQKRREHVMRAQVIHQWYPCRMIKIQRAKWYINKKLSDRILVQNPSVCFTHFHFIPPKSAMRMAVMRHRQRAIAYSPILQKGELRFAREVNGRSLLSPQPVWQTCQPTKTAQAGLHICSCLTTAQGGSEGQELVWGSEAGERGCFNKDQAYKRKAYIREGGGK